MTSSERWALDAMNGQRFRTGADLRKLRKAAGMTQARLSALSGYTRENLSECERGNHSPSFRKMLNCVEAMGFEFILMRKL